jgi:hypothetical protein
MEIKSKIPLARRYPVQFVLRILPQLIEDFILPQPSVFIYILFNCILPSGIVMPSLPYEA